jgi:hypothetical protein
VPHAYQDDSENSKTAWEKIGWLLLLLSPTSDIIPCNQAVHQVLHHLHKARIPPAPQRMYLFQQ